MPERRFLILHGLSSRREPGHWHSWLAEQLRSSGEQVLYPQLPRPDEPVLAEWLDLLRAELRMLGDRERIVICHSLGCRLWMHHALGGCAGPPVDRVLLVCPPAPAVVQSLAPGFTGPLPAARDLARVAASTVVVGSDDDPYDPPGPAAQAAALGVPLVLASGAGHVNRDSGFGPWPGVLAWCVTGDPAALTDGLDATRAA